MAVTGTFESFRDINPARVARVFSKYADSPAELARAKKGKLAKFTSDNRTIAQISSELSQIGRIISCDILT